MRELGPKLVAIDPSLTCSGWALFSIEESVLLGVGKIRSLPPAIPLSQRLEDLQRKVSNLLIQLALGGNDVLVCEAPTTMRDPRAALKVEQVRVIFEALARERSLAVPGRLNPRSVQYEVMGLKGKQLKRTVIKSTAVTIVHRLYKRDLSQLGFDCSPKNLSRNQDIVDAVLVGSLGLARIKASRFSHMPLETLFQERANARRFTKAQFGR